MNTPKNYLEAWVAAQATPWDSHNKALFEIDQIMQISVLDVALPTPPGSESEGDAYIVAGPATGDWAGQENTLAYFLNGTYSFKALVPGSLIYNQDDGKWYAWTGTVIAETNIATI